MESRKIQRSVSGSYIVTLPKEWVESHGVSKGERVSVYVNEEGVLCMVPGNPGAVSPKECYLNFEDYDSPSAVERRVKACYVEGDDIITVSSKKTIPADLKGQIKAAASDLIGMEVSEDFSNRVVLRTLVDPMRFPVRDLMKRIYVLASSMHQDAVESLRSRNMDLARDVMEREREVQKLYRLLQRQLMIAVNRSEIARALGIRDFRSSLIAAIVARGLNRVAYYGADIARQVVESGSDLPDSLPEELYQMSEVTRAILENSMAAYFTEDFNLANRVIDQLPQVREMDTKVEEKAIRMAKKPVQAILLTRISRSLRRIAFGASTIAEETLIKVDSAE